MKKSLMCLLILLTLSTESIVAQTGSNQLWLIRMTKVQPAKVENFETALNIFNASLKKAKVSNVEFYANSTQTYEYYFAAPIENMAQLDKSYWGEAIAKVGKEKFMKEATAMDAYKVEETSGIYLQPEELNYVHPSLKAAELNYRVWQIYETKPGSSFQFEALVKEWNALFKKHDVVRAHSIFFSLVGSKEGVIVVLISAKNAADYAQQTDDLFKKTGAEGRDLWNRTQALMTNLHIKKGYFRPDISVSPMLATENAEK